MDLRDRFVAIDFLSGRGCHGECEGFTAVPLYKTAKGQEGSLRNDITAYVALERAQIDILTARKLRKYSTSGRSSLSSSPEPTNAASSPGRP